MSNLNYIFPPHNLKRCVYEPNDLRVELIEYMHVKCMFHFLGTFSPYFYTFYEPATLEVLMTTPDGDETNKGNQIMKSLR